MFESVLTGLLIRYAATIVGTAVTSIAGYAISHWGATPENVAAVGGGVATVGAAIVTAISKNKDVATVFQRFPIAEVLQAIADSTKAKVTQIRVDDPALARSVPSEKVVAGNATKAGVDPAGNGSIAG